MTSIDVLVTAWPRDKHRADYLEQTLRALKKNLTFRDGTLNWICSSEGRKLDADAAARRDAVCRELGFQQLTHNGKPCLGSHMNYALKQTASPYVFYVQDDWLLEGPLDLSEGVAFHQRHPECGYLRYYWKNPKLPATAKGNFQWIEGAFYALPKSHPYQFSHNPYLAHRRFFKKLGAFRDQTGNERDMCRRVIRADYPVAVHEPSVFRHVGQVTTLQARYLAHLPAKLAFGAEVEAFDPSFRASKSVLDSLRKLLCEHRPPKILELGPGLSTFLFLRYMAAQKWHAEPDFLSIDHIGPYHEILRNRLEADGYKLGGSCRLAAVPLLEGSGFYDVSTLYELSILEPDAKFDLIFVDGPPSSARRNNSDCRKFLRRHSHSRTIFVVDDTHRGGEQKLASYAESLIGRPVDRLVIPDKQYKRQSVVLLPQK